MLLNNKYKLVIYLVLNVVLLNINILINNNI